MLVDAHCHVQESVIYFKKWIEEGIIPVLTGHNMKSNKLAFEFFKKYRVPYVVGIAPQNASKERPSFNHMFEEAFAVGEIGLDYHWAKGEKERERQKEIFVEQLVYAKERKKPVVIHSRKSIEDVVELLNKYYSGRVMFHFFSENVRFLDELKSSIEFFISIVALPSKHRKKALKSYELDKFLVETDGPYVIREPDGVLRALEYISSVKGKDIEVVKRYVFDNAERFFKVSLNSLRMEIEQ